MLSEQDFYLALEERCGPALAGKLRSAGVAVCGLGGPGSNIALYLARAGVGHLKIIDYDKVELHNLNRQQYKVSQVGEYKVSAAKANILEAAPYTEVEAVNARINAENACRLLEGFEIICEAFDDPDQKAMLANAVRAGLPTAYLIAASGMAGLGPAGDIATRRVSSRFYVCGDFTADRAQGMYAPRVALCAAHQALAVLRIISGRES